MIRWAAACVVLMVMVPAAMARTAADCQHIQNPHEFNLCLASDQPVRGKARASRPPRQGASRAVPVRAVRRGSRVHSVLSFASGGRKRMSFDVRR